MTALLVFIFLAVITTIAFSLWCGITPMPTSPTVRKTLLKNLPETFEGTIYELGAGWGTLAFPLSRKYPQAEIYAFEVSPIPYLWMHLRKLVGGYNKVNIRFKNIYSVSFSDANLVICYLYPKAMQILETILPENAAVISHTFAFSSRKPCCTIHCNDLYRTPIYYYGVESESFSNCQCASSGSIIK